jgi:hypothetical protein
MFGPVFMDGTVTSDIYLSVLRAVVESIPPYTFCSISVFSGYSLLYSKD